MTQYSPCYSVLSALLHEPLPDSSNYSTFCHIHYLFAGSFTAADFTAEFSRELMSLDEYCSVLRKLNVTQRQVVMFHVLLFKLCSQLLFCLTLFSFLSFSILSLHPFSILSSSFLLPSIPSPLSLLINSLSSYDKNFKFHSVSLLRPHSYELFS